MSAVYYRFYLLRNIPICPIVRGCSFKVPRTCIIQTSKYSNSPCLKVTDIKRRFLHSTMANSNNKVVNYDDVVSYKDKTDVLLIDVREPQELIDTGIIPSSINIPLGDVIKTLKESSPEDFKKKYNREFPSKDTQLVFTCKMGGRAGKAMDAAIQLGYVNSKFYEGSWLDWASRQNN